MAKKAAVRGVKTVGHSVHGTGRPIIPKGSTAKRGVAAVTGTPAKGSGK